MTLAEQQHIQTLGRIYMARRAQYLTDRRRFWRQFRKAQRQYLDARLAAAVRWSCPVPVAGWGPEEQEEGEA